MAADGSMGVLTMLWRRVTIEERLHVHEIWGGDHMGVFYGPFDDEAACTAFIKSRVVAMKKTWTVGREAALARYPQTIIPPRKEKTSDAA